mmetsp:Transcript_50160/g.95826  ORF Transcript_50160/g.95826 Transcript_50160/m.95826 type:complete len:309 (-) Transcript_50160:61-987(-)
MMSEIPNVSRKYSEEDYNVVIWQQGSNDGALEYRDLKGKELQNACANGREQDVLRLQAEGADANTKNQSGHTCLITAAINGHAHVLAALLDAGTDPNQTDDCGASPLLWACYVGNVAMIQNLIDHGANVNCVDMSGCGALSLTARHGHTWATKALLQANADVHAVDQLGRTALMLAVSGGHTDVVQLLIMHGAKIDQADSSGCTMLEYARLGRQPVLIDDILRPLTLTSTTSTDLDIHSTHRSADPKVEYCFRHVAMTEDKIQAESWERNQHNVYAQINKETVCDLFQRLEDFRGSRRRGRTLGSQSE